MTAIQLKTEIQKTLDEVPEDVLPEILTKFMELTLTEDKELLKRLAQ
jgi:hypothetical protein